MRRTAAIVIGNVAAAAPAIARDLAAVSGAGLISYGMWQAWEPLGFISLGTMLLTACVLSARRAD
jgi:hypothetical protein